MPFDQFWKTVDEKTIEAANFVLFGCGKFTFDLVRSKMDWYRYDLIWEKNNKCGFLNANLMPLRTHESILIFGKPGYQKVATYNPQKTRGGKIGSYGRNKNSSVYQNKCGYECVGDGTLHPCSIVKFNNDKDRVRRHPTQKPVGLMQWLVSSYSNTGDTIIDPFMGSGTTGVAAIKLGRAFVGIEQKKKYFDIACQRIRQAVKEHQNQFPEVQKMVEAKKLF